MTDTDHLLVVDSESAAIQDSLGRRSSTATGSQVKFARARPWPCRPCGLLLGTSHVTLGCLLVVYDVSTNSISETAFAISAALCFIVSGVLGLIASRRLDKATLLLFLVFVCTSLGLTIAMFVESVLLINRLCYSMHHCTHVKTSIHAALVCFSLIEGTICTVSIIVCIRSLRNVYRLVNPASPYSTLVLGDFRPSSSDEDMQVINQHKKSQSSHNKVMMQYLVAK